MWKIILALVLLYSGSAWAQVGQIATWPPKAIVIGGGGASCASASNTEVQTWGSNVDGQGGTVSATECGYADTLISSLKSTLGTPLSSQVSRLWLATSADANVNQFKVDLIHGALLDFTNANIGARWNKTTGYTPNGTSEYIITPFTPSTSDTGVFATASATMAVYLVSSNVPFVADIPFAAYDGANADQIEVYQPTSYNTIYVNNITPTDNGAPGGVTTLFGLFMGTLNAGNITAFLYQSTSRISDFNALSGIALPAVPFYIGAQNNNGTPATFSPDSGGAYFLGRGLTSFAEADGVAAAINAYMTSVGASHY